MDAEGFPDFLLALGERQSVREFCGPPISVGTLHSILELALRAPSEFDLQPWRLVVCHDLADRQRLRACCLDQPQVEAAGADVVVFGSPRDLLERAEAAAAELDAAGRLSTYTREECVEFIRTFYGADASRTRACALRNAVLFAHHLLIAERTRAARSDLRGFMTFACNQHNVALHSKLQRLRNGSAALWNDLDGR